MPNWCYGRLKINTTQEKREEVLNFLSSSETPFDFNKVIPMPDYIYDGPIGQEEEKKYGAMNWYNWRIFNWGTKWNACDVRVEGDSLYFWTAWSPCHRIIFVLSTKFPDVLFEYGYGDEGCCFCGKDIYMNGEIKEQEAYDYPYKGSEESIAEFNYHMKRIMEDFIGLEPSTYSDVEELDDPPIPEPVTCYSYAKAY